MDVAIAAPIGTADGKGKVSRSSKRTAEAKGHPDRQRLIQEFTEAYKADCGAAYKFGGAKDGKAANELLATATAEEIIELAKAAWKLPDGARFLRQQASTLAGLASKWNEIQKEVNRNGGIKGGQSDGTDEAWPQ